MNYNYIILNLFILHYIILYHNILYYIILCLFLYLSTVYLKEAIIRINWRDLDCGNQAILRGNSQRMRKANGGGGNTSQSLRNDLLYLPAWVAQVACQPATRVSMINVGCILLGGVGNVLAWVTCQSGLSSSVGGIVPCQFG